VILRKRKGNAGFNLVELMVVLLLFAIIVLAIFGVLLVGRQSWKTGETQLELQQESRRAMEKIVNELRQSGQISIDPGPVTPIAFQIPEDTDSDGDVIDGSGNVEWGGQITYSWAGTGSPLIRVSGGVTTILANKVQNIQFTRNADVIEILLQVQKDALQGRTLQSTLYSRVKLRN
jgi:prepilin-type N-terminal cleavage/methylation domain-containing protein